MDWIPIGTLFVGIVGLAVAVAAYFTRVINRIVDRYDSNFEAIDNKFEQVELRFDRVEERLTRIEGRLDSVDRRLDGIEKRIDGMDQRMEGMDQRMDGMDQRMYAMEQRQTVFEARVDKAFQDARDDSAAMLEAVQALGVEQARMLGFLEGRGIMGLAQVEATPTP